MIRADWFSGHILEKSIHIDKPFQYVINIYYNKETKRLTPVDVN